MKRNRKLSNIRRAIGAIVIHEKFKIIIWTIIASICVGLFLGYLILKIVSNDEHVTTEGSLEEEQHGENQIELPNFSIYVLQGGVFTEEDNATTYGKQIEHTKLSHVVRESEEQYYVWLSVIADEASATKQMKKLKDKDVNSIVKEWDIPSVTITLPDNELEWLTSFTQLLSEAVQTNKIEQQELQRVVKQENELMTFKSWYEELQKIISQEKISSDQLMLQILVHYERFINDQK